MRCGCMDYEEDIVCAEMYSDKCDIVIYVASFLFKI